MLLSGYQNFIMCRGWVGGDYGLWGKVAAAFVVGSQVSRKVRKDDASRSGDAGKTHHHGCDKEFSSTLQALDRHIMNFFTILILVA